MRDNPLIQTIFNDFDRESAPARKHSVGGVLNAADESVVIARVALGNDATSSEVRRWLKEAGKL